MGCHYEPVGNIEGMMPYDQGNGCSACPTGYVCDRNQCVLIPTTTTAKPINTTTSTPINTTTTKAPTTTSTPTNASTSTTNATTTTAKP
uniref:SCP domain-containing protein n=1 Tax=Mesocestoides corti TaxID=53468 RepID=A0A5K3FXP7_MESCO